MTRRGSSGCMYIDPKALQLWNSTVFLSSSPASITVSSCPLLDSRELWSGHNPLARCGLCCTAGQPGFCHC